MLDDITKEIGAIKFVIDDDDEKYILQINNDIF